VTSRFGFTGEYYAQETGMWHLRARDLHPSLGRFLSADPVQPNAPGTQGYNRYAYVANNPTTWVDPSGYSVEPLAADQALLGMMYAMHRSLHAVLRCALSEECRDLQALMKKLGSRGANFMVWTAEELQKAFFSTYPHQPTPVDPGLLVLSLGLSNTPVIGDFYDLYTGVTGYDPITGQYLAGWERLANIAGGLILFPGVTGSNIRHGVHAAESFIEEGDDLIKLGKRTGAYYDNAIGGGTGLGKLAGRQIRVTDKGLSIVTAHLAQAGFEQVPENAAMIGRLQEALTHGKLISGADASFYLHEVSEATMMKRLVQNGLSFDGAYDVAHSAVLNKYEVSPFSVYHPDVIQALGPSHFNSSWWNFWGIKP
jgi:RHS repeat-associated protein